MPVQTGSQLRERQRVVELLGARDLILECEEMLLGARERFTPMDEYLRQRLDYWQARFNALDLRHGARRGTAPAALAAGGHSERRRAQGRRSSDRATLPV
ncbi:MAG: hypothetical protein ACYDAG_02045 [Chloroflexota bacterium]